MNIKLFIYLFSMAMASCVAELQEIQEKNSRVYYALSQGYEKEFSPLTGAECDENGQYSVREWRSPMESYYWLVEGEIVGFCLKDTQEGYSDVAEFYIAPQFRGKGEGTKMARALFDNYPGPWQVLQLESAVKARGFWLKVLEEYTKGEFAEDKTVDPIWGNVTRQRFN